MFKSNVLEYLGAVLAGAIGMLVLLLLTGASFQPSAGRYQMEVVTRDRATHVYVMDTASGAVKWVDKMNSPFEEMKGD